MHATNQATPAPSDHWRGPENPADDLREDCPEGDEEETTCPEKGYFLGFSEDRDWYGEAKEDRYADEL